MESQLSLEKKINVIAFLDHFLHLFKFLVFHEATFWIRGFGKIPYFSKNHKEKCHTYVRRYAFISGLYNGLNMIFTWKRTSLSIWDLLGADGDLILCIQPSAIDTSRIRFMK